MAISLPLSASQMRAVLSADAVTTRLPSPLNAAVINSVGAHIRATALAVNIFIIHILGDVFSPTLMGSVADRHSLQTSFILPVIAMVLSSLILFFGMRFAPRVQADVKPVATGAH